MLPGWLRRNGVPYSQNAVITENFTRFTHPDAGDWFVVTTTVEDPQYLAQPFITSSNFKKEADDSKWNPQPCKSSVGRASGLSSRGYRIDVGRGLIVRAVSAR